MNEPAMQRNWAGTVHFGPSARHRPTTVAELGRLVAGSRRLRVLGTGHSFTDLADTDGDLVSLAGLESTVEVGPTTVRVPGGRRYGDVVGALHAAGLALPNLASLPHIAVAGACATGTHGSGRRLGGLATAVAAVELMGPDGTVSRIARGEPEFDGHVVALGALGPMVALTLDVVPAFDVAQYWYDDLPAEALTGELDTVLSAGYSVSVFTDWGGRIAVLRKLTHPTTPPAAGPWLGARPATTTRHPIAGQPTDAVTPQRGEPGPAYARLPHFRLEFTPSHGEELQSEYFVPFAAGPAAIAAVTALADRIRPLLLVSELRAVAADTLWLSPAYQRDSLTIHFTWVRDEAGVRAVLPALEAALAPFDARPHWGKVFGHGPAALARLYPRLESFVDLAARRDPTGKFRNAWLDHRLPRQS